MPKRYNPYPDHVFGDLDRPAKGSAYLLKHTRFVQHNGRKEPVLPMAGQPLQLSVTTSSDLPAVRVRLVYTSDDWASKAELKFEKFEVGWDTLSWSYLQHWRLVLPPQVANSLLRYKIAAQLPGGGEVYADNQAADFGRATSFALWYDPNPAPPAWSAQARIYQVFVDRFNPGSGRTWSQTSDLLKPFGGTLRGVIEKLDYIKSLGFNALWLTPIFKSPTHHGYDTSDYEQIEPRLGTEDDLRELLSAAHARGMRLILDFVANHVSDQHPALRASLRDPSDPRNAWFRWKPWPRYESFYDVKSMPNLNLSYGSPARVHLLSVAQKWLGLGVDGYRLDYAHGPEADFWVDFRRACRQVNPECWTFGELTLPADALLTYAGGMDGALDFLTCQALRETFGRSAWPLSRLAGFLEGSQAFFPQPFSRPAFIDNHDMNRFRFMALDSQPRLHAALSLLYLLPGAPIVYYGTESGLAQNASIHDRGSHGFDEARLPMNWEQAGDHPTAKLMRNLSAFREANPWLARARWQVLSVEDERQKAVFQVSGEGHSLKVFIDLTEADTWVIWE